MTEVEPAHSPTPIETIETPASVEKPAGGGVTPEQWVEMRRIIEAIYAYREPE